MTALCLDIVMVQQLFLKQYMGAFYLSQLNTTLKIPVGQEAFIEEEVHDALLDPNKDKARGPNGFSLTFWQYCWDFVKELLALYKDFLARCTFDSKRKGFKPLSLNEFVEGRQILDVVLIANEGIDSRLRSVNRELFIFQNIEGLRYKDPLSSYLFVLVMEAFNEMGSGGSLDLKFQGEEPNVEELASMLGRRVGKLLVTWACPGTLPSSLQLLRTWTLSHLYSPLLLPKRHGWMMLGRSSKEEDSTALKAIRSSELSVKSFYSALGVKG
ncbi:hypothetical protein CK203_079528 [Vitis vinifera]|uniref:Uncharacterized protein n=1 Tax=Vitis vinifera TaxID=29760 RepID=A0A438CNZ6_VITVI|nr:hypothetical protein CK203_079528 [Vitis vinifera]